MKAPPALTPVQRAVLRHLTAGRSREATARALFLGMRTADWVEPRPREAEAVRQLAGGAEIHAIAASIGVSARTVWLDLARLAASNGVLITIHAGARYEALHWT